MTAEEAEAAYGTILRKVYAAQDAEVPRMVDESRSMFSNGAPEPWPEGKVPLVNWVDPHAKGPPRAPLEERLKSLAHLLHDGIITEAQVAHALRQTLDEHVPKQPVPVVERLLHCATCRRVFCRVQLAEGTWVMAVCEGCEREGRR